MGFFVSGGWGILLWPPDSACSFRNNMFFQFYSLFNPWVLHQNVSFPKVLMELINVPVSSYGLFFCG